MPAFAAEYATWPIWPSNAAIDALHLRVQQALAGLFEPETRPFRPHVTLARLRDADSAAVRRWLRGPADHVAFEAREFILFESRPGSDYRAIAVYPLTDG